MRKTKFINGECYHIFNRGVDKRIIFANQKEMQRFFRKNTAEYFGEEGASARIRKRGFLEAGLL